MSKLSGARLSLVVSVAGVGFVLSSGLGQTLAGDDITEDQIVNALLPPQKPLTRGLSVGPKVDQAASEAEGRFVQGIRGRTTLSRAEREEIATIAKDKPNIDLEITFDYNSAAISAASPPSVQALGRALTTPELKGSTFIVAGHTDAAGADAYNQDLSERRADSIKRFLMRNYGMAGTDLVAVGYGKSK